ncbi:hypothetical protein [Pseudomonas viridiflava]|uniref:hypothetical protein n=2 Tax=Pseudomonas viridiflava TaxID=33069 RepID=UPI001F13DCAF|nr:hypothetical protein [Pseudomonas viridiflava]
MLTRSFTSMTATFETALDKHETCEFFKGEGLYFARGSDWGDHLYISNWQEMCGFLKNQKAAQSVLTKIFDEYVTYLEVSSIACFSSALDRLSGLVAHLPALGESYQFPETLIDFFIHLCNVPFSGLLLFVHEKQAF